MIYFTDAEFKEKYPEYSQETISQWKIEAVSEMIFSQVGLTRRDDGWNAATVPSLIKNAAMEQMRFLIEYEIPFVDFKDGIKAGSMDGKLKTDYSTLALRMLANGGYLYRGNPMMSNIGINIPWGN